MAHQLLVLLLAKDEHHQAASDIHPFYRDINFMGTIGMDKMAPPLNTANPNRKKNHTIATGWKLQNLNNTVDSILASASRLEKEIELETKYWEEALAINNDGWALTRLPDPKKPIGVIFGFLDSAPSFKNRSVAAIQRGTDGHIILDKGLTATEPQTLRVRIRTNNEFTGCSVIEQATSDGASLEAVLLESRNSIFAEELWQEINREARILAAYDVRSKDGTVIYPISATKELVIDLVLMKDDAMSPSRPDDAIAEGINLALKLLLGFVHREINLERRQAAETEAKSHSNAKPNVNANGNVTTLASLPYTLLRPLITRLSHENTISNISNFCHPFIKLLNSADLGSVFKIHYDRKSGSWEMAKPKSSALVIMEYLTKGLEITTELWITANLLIRIVTRTEMGSVIGSFHKITLPQTTVTSLPFTCIPPDGPLDTWSKVEEYVMFTTACAVISSMTTKQTVEGLPEPDYTTEQEKTPWQQTFVPTVLQSKISTERGMVKQFSFAIEKDGPDTKTAGVLRATAKWQWTKNEMRSKGGEGSYQWIGKIGDDHDNVDEEVAEVVRSFYEVLKEARRE